ncbi:Nitrogen fixation protein rnfC [Raoultella terrigena]|uniref:Nitrogen fixation protein rnfC n=1 Tax=Raoultella terrigena TaxID=577 RepID=A0A4U9CWE8_RAOTE|nr:Nitrogen fixation protein rnfC [Raoultella terrigena]
MHTVMSDLCTGCNLCVAPCPTQCIEMVPVARPLKPGSGIYTPSRCASFLWNNMFKLFSAFKKDKVWDFNGGIHPPEMKTQSNGTPLRQVSLAQQFVIPLKQHIGRRGRALRAARRSPPARPAAYPRWGKMLPVHAPTSGVVSAIAPHSTAHPSALAEMSVIIDADGEDRWIERDGWSDYQSKSREELIERIHQFGVAGLGGAGFPTGIKLRGGGDKIDTPDYYAAECEPYITADDRLMQDCAGADYRRHSHPGPYFTAEPGADRH